MSKMGIRDLIFATLVMALWGLNFVMIHLGLYNLSPYWLCCFRFFLASVPFVFFIKRPVAPFKLVLAYGLITFAAQYALLFCGMQLGMPAGLAALLYQTQVFFSILIAWVAFKERPTIWQTTGIVTAFVGLGIIATNLDGSATFSGFFLTIAAALCWAVGNIITKYMGKVNMLSLVVWGNFVSVPPIILFTLFMEGPSSLALTWQALSPLGLVCIFYIAYVSTVFCFTVWSGLLQRYPVATVAPFTLSVPVFAMLSSNWLANEPITWWKIVAGLFIMSGLVMNLFGSRIAKCWRRATRSRLSHIEN